MSKFTRFLGDQTDPKSACGGPNSFLRTGSYTMVDKITKKNFFLKTALCAQTCLRTYLSTKHDDKESRCIWFTKTPNPWLEDFPDEIWGSERFPVAQFVHVMWWLSVQLGLGSDRIVRTAFRCKVEETFTSVSEAAKIVKIGLKEKAGCCQSCYAKALLYFHVTLNQNKHKTRVWRDPSTRPIPNFLSSTRPVPTRKLKMTGYRVIEFHLESNKT